MSLEAALRSLFEAASLLLAAALASFTAAVLAVLLLKLAHLLDLVRVRRGGGGC